MIFSSLTLNGFYPHYHPSVLIHNFKAEEQQLSAKQCPRLMCLFVQLRAHRTSSSTVTEVITKKISQERKGIRLSDNSHSDTAVYFFSSIKHKRVIKTLYPLYPVLYGKIITISPDQHCVTEKADSKKSC